MKLEIKKFTQRLFFAIARHAFLVSLFLFGLSLIFGWSLFYKYVILTRKIEPEVLEKPFLINERNYQDVLKAWQEQEERFEKANFKEYPDLFRKLAPEELTLRRQAPPLGVGN